MSAEWLCEETSSTHKDSGLSLQQATGKLKGRDEEKVGDAVLRGRGSGRNPGGGSSVFTSASVGIVLFSREGPVQGEAELEVSRFSLIAPSGQPSAQQVGEELGHQPLRWT